MIGCHSKCIVAWVRTWSWEDCGLFPDLVQAMGVFFSHSPMVSVTVDYSCDAHHISCYASRKGKCFFGGLGGGMRLGVTSNFSCDRA